MKCTICKVNKKPRALEWVKGVPYTCDDCFGDTVGLTTQPEDGAEIADALKTSLALKEQILNEMYSNANDPVHGSIDLLQVVKNVGNMPEQYKVQALSLLLEDLDEEQSSSTDPKYTDFLDKTIETVSQLKEHLKKGK